MGQNNYLRVYLGRQRCVYDVAKGFLYFWLRRGAYLTAGRKFGWNPPPALGVNRRILEYAIEKELKIRVFENDRFDRAYEADPQPWLDFALNHPAIDRQKGRDIYSYPWSQFKTVFDIPPEVVKIFRGF